MMNHEEYIRAVEAGKYPDEMLVPMPENFLDERGEIKNLLFSKVNSIATIVSKAGTIRSNHFHRTDYHFLFCVSGSMEYWERNIDGTDVKMIIVTPGQMVFTGPNKIHKTVFLEDTVLLSMAKNIRDHEHHEEDVVRVEF